MGQWDRSRRANTRIGYPCGMAYGGLREAVVEVFSGIDPKRI